MRDLSTTEARRELTRERMIATVAVGKPGTAMKGFAGQLPPEDMEAVVEYMRSQVISGGFDGISGTSAHGKP